MSSYRLSEICVVSGFGFKSIEFYQLNVTGIGRLCR